MGGKAPFPTFAAATIFAAARRLPPVLRERFWNCPPNTGYRSPGCWRTPGRPSGTVLIASWPPRATPLPR
jgi:hypothetical protein